MVGFNTKKLNSLCIVLALLILPGQGHAQELDGPVFEPVIKMGEEVNSDAEEIFPILSPDGKTLYFSRYLHPGNQGGKVSGHDIWVSSRQGNQWSMASNYTGLNTTLNDAIIGLSRSGKKAYLMNENDQEEPGIQHVILNGKDVDYDPSREYLEFPSSMQKIYGAYVHQEGNLAMISSKSDSLRNGYDILLYKKVNEQWQKIEVEGLNSKTDEFSPFLSHDSILYFSSNRKGGFGSFDIYWSKPLNAGLTKWSEPKNLGESVNSSKYEAYFSTYPDSSAYLVSNRGSKLSDIFYTKLQPTIEEEDTTGKIDSIKLEVSIKERIGIMMDHVRDFGRAAPEYVFFEFDSTRITDSASIALDLFIRAINENELVGIELRGYADSIGTKAYNEELSRNRSSSVKKYLLDNGIEEMKIRVLGFGEEDPIASNATDRGRAKNRRVRLVLIRQEE